MGLRGASRICVFGLVVISLLVSMSPAVRGRRAEFAGQVIVGTVGGALMGAVGSLVGARICAAGGDRCQAPVYGYLVGIPLGATLGVGIAASAFGLEGDYPLAAVGAVVGELLGVGILAVLRGTLGEEATFAAAYGLVPFLSATLSATGFRAGAAPGELEAALAAFALERIAPSPG